MFKNDNGAFLSFRSYFSQLGELNISLGVSEPRYTLEVIYFTHIGSLGKVIEYLGG